MQRLQPLMGVATLLLCGLHLGAGELRHLQVPAAESVSRSFQSCPESDLPGGSSPAAWPQQQKPTTGWGAILMQQGTRNSQSTVDLEGGPDGAAARHAQAAADVRDATTFLQETVASEAKQVLHVTAQIEAKAANVTAQIEAKAVDTAELLMALKAREHPVVAPTTPQHGDIYGDSLEPAPEHAHHRYFALLFFFGTLAIGSLILMALERFHLSIPYTMALFVAGGLVEVVHHFKSHDSIFHWESWYTSVGMWEAINPHLIFYAFLPALLFGEAMRLNSQLVTTCCWQVLLLACPGVLVGTALTGCVGYYVLPYGWGWPISLVFGSILAATDPVAVVALFNTLGVSPRLTMLISGESLLNDGTAIVVFALMLKIALGATVGAWGIVGFFGQMTLVAILWGGLLGGLAVVLIGKCAEQSYKSDSMIQVVVTLCCGYLAFFIAETELSTSGVLATVSSGYVVAFFSWPRFANRETMHTVWETIEFVGNTLIFFLAGLIFGHISLSRRHFISLEDVGWLLVVYVCMMLIRAFMVGLFWYPLNYLGSPFQWREGVVMVWSGLRGAVSLAMAIIVDLEPEISPQMGSRIMFLVGGSAALTFIVNATLAPQLLRLLGLTRASRARSQVLKRLSKHVDQQTMEACEQQLSSRKDIRFSQANMSLVQEMLQQDFSGGQDDGTGQLAGEEAGGEQEAEELATVYREIWLRMVQHHYWGSIGEGIIPRTLKVARTLLHSTDEALDSTWQKLNDWEVVARDLGADRPGTVTHYVRFLAECRPFCWIPEFQRSVSEDYRIMQEVYVVLSFQEAHMYAQEEVKKYLSTRDPVAIEVMQRVASESEDQLQRASALLGELSQDSVELGRSEMLARKLLHQQLSHVEHMEESGLLTPSEASSMQQKTLATSRKIVNAPKDSWMNKPAARISATSGFPRVTFTTPLTDS